MDRFTTLLICGGVLLSTPFSYINYFKKHLIGISEEVSNYGRDCKCNTKKNKYIGVAFFQGNFLAGNKYTFTLSTENTITSTSLIFLVSSGVTGTGLTDAYAISLLTGGSFNGEKVLEWTPKQDYNNFYARIVGDGLGANNYVINLHAIAY
jgi:hypothetical protein